MIDKALKTKIFKFFLILILLSSSLVAEDVYSLAQKVIKIREVKEIIRKERRLFYTIAKYYIDLSEWPRDGGDDGWEDINAYLKSDTGEIFNNYIFGRKLNFKIDRYNKTVDVYYVDNNFKYVPIDFDANQKDIYYSRPEARRRDGISDRNATFMFEKLNRKGLIGAQKKHILIDPTPLSGVTTTKHPDGSIGYAKYYFNITKVYWQKFIVHNGIWVRHD